MNAAQLSYEDIKIGNVYEFEQIITEDDVMKFAELVGDYNPFHVDPEFGKKSQFGKNVVHGMLAASLFSRLVGMYCPGEKALYLSQTLNFRRPLFYGEKVTTCGKVINKNDSIQVVTLKTEIFKNDELIIDGEAKIKILQS
ncbi:MAG: MaoC family dehydratase [bacterium]|nr:MaoC family dehydratase [bacterium]